MKRFFFKGVLTGKLLGPLFEPKSDHTLFVLKSVYFMFVIGNMIFLPVIPNVWTSLVTVVRFAFDLCT